MKEIRLQFSDAEAARLAAAIRQSPPPDPTGLPAAEAEQLRYYLRTVPPAAEHIDDDVDHIHWLLYGGL